MNRIALVLLLLAALGSAGGKAVVEFRLRDDPTATLRGWILEFTDDGFRFERFGGGRKLSIDWENLVGEDRSRIRQRLKLDVTEEERLGLMDAHRLHLRGGATVEGLLTRVDEDGRHWLKKDGLMLAYPRDRVSTVEKIRLKENAIYSPEEVYWRRIERIPPNSASQHRDLAERLVEIGAFKRARQHFEEAIRLRPQWQARLQPRMDELDALLKDKVLADFLKRTRAAYRLHKNYAKARADLNAFIDEHPERKRAAMQVLDDLNDHEADDTRRRLHIVKNEEAERAIEELVSRKPTLEEGLSWIRSELLPLVRKRLVDRLNLTPEEVEEALKEKPESSPHWASYWSGSFVFSRRARKGKASSKMIRGDPDGWWDRYQDKASRKNFLQAYAAEQVPELFEVVEVRLTDCVKCGGKGQVKHMSVRQLQGGGHEWMQLCPRCFGARQDRGVAYK